MRTTTRLWSVAAAILLVTLAVPAFAHASVSAPQAQQYPGRPWLLAKGGGSSSGADWQTNPGYAVPLGCSIQPVIPNGGPAKCKSRQARLKMDGICRSERARNSEQKGSLGRTSRLNGRTMEQTRGLMIGTPGQRAPRWMAFGNGGGFDHGRFKVTKVCPDYQRNSRD